MGRGDTVPCTQTDRRTGVHIYIYFYIIYWPFGWSYRNIPLPVFRPSMFISMASSSMAEFEAFGNNDGINIARVSIQRR